MVNPVTGKKQLEDYLYTGKPKRKKPIDFSSMSLEGLPEKEDLSPEMEPGGREELDGNLKHKK